MALDFSIAALEAIKQCCNPLRIQGLEDNYLQLETVIQVCSRASIFSDMCIT